MAGLIRRDLTSAFKLLRDRSSHNAADFYDLDRDEKVRSLLILTILYRVFQIFRIHSYGKNSIYSKVKLFLNEYYD